MLFVVCLSFGLFLPLAGFLSLAIGSNFFSNRLNSFLAALNILISFLCFCTILFLYESVSMSPQSITLYNWIPIEGIDAQFHLRIDPLSLLMSLIITGIGFLIHVYSIGYMEHEEYNARYFACLNFFVFAMLLLVLAGDLLLLFVGWEGVGLASYLLIGYWYQRPAAAQAAKKAFIVNRIADVGFLIGLLLMLSLFETSQLSEVFLKAEQRFPMGSPLLTLMTFLFFIGAIGKSAQLPLHVWLPDAMEGPTPVSALIHAATMVTGGVYLVVRMHPIFILTPITLHFIGFIGGATALFAALCAVAQTDLKRVLAYSTISQLGLMFLACGIGAFYAAMFHLTTHAFVKGLLFLAAGNVVHMTHNVTDMGQMGGLAKVFTKTHWLFLIGVLAMSGVPPLAAFFSKDLILEQEHLAGFDTLFYVALATSMLTGFYLMRAYCLTFLGPRHTQLEVHEAPLVMLTPVFTLSILSIVGGFLGFCLFCTTPILERFLAEVGITLAEKEELTIPSLFTFTTFLSIGGVLLGVLSAALLYTRFINRLGSALQLLNRGFFMNELYANGIVYPLKRLSSFISTVLEPKLFDRSLSITTQIMRSLAQQLQRFQSGQIRSYIAWMVLGSVFLMIYLIL